MIHRGPPDCLLSYHVSSSLAEVRKFWRMSPQVLMTGAELQIAQGSQMQRTIVSAK